MKKILCLIALVLILILSLVFVLTLRGDDTDTELTIEVNADGYVVVNGVATDILADKSDVITVDADGFVVVNGVKTEHKIHTTDEISVNADGYVVVNGAATDILADKSDVITVDADGYVVVNGVKTEHKILDESLVDEENPQGLLFVLRDDGTYAVESGSAKYEEQIEIPATYKGKAVTEIRSFVMCSNLKEIVIPEGIKEIGEQAFFRCTSLPKIVLPNSIISIGDYAFEACKNLVSVTIGCGLEECGTHPFEDSERIIEVINHSNVTIERGAVDHHTGDSKVSRIGDYVFYENDGVAYLVAYLGNDADIVLPENYNGKNYEIYGGVFSKEDFQNDNLRNVVIPDGVTRIHYHAFCRSALRSVSIGNSVKTIDSDAFVSCVKLTSVTLGSGVETIGDDCFYGCISLIEVVNNSALAITIGSEDYGGIAYYAKDVHRGESNFERIGDYVFFSTNATNYLVYYDGDTKEVVLPDAYHGGQYEINNYAFADSAITGVIVSDGVSSIGNSAFKDCKKLKNLVIGKNVASIGADAFECCYRLEKIQFNATALPDYATYASVFSEAGRESEGIEVRFGANVTRIPAYLFCPHPGYDYLLPTITRISFESGSVLEEIGAYAFYRCKGVTEIVLPSGLTSVGNYSFYSFPNLADVYFPGSETEWAEITIGDNNASLTSATIHYNYIPE